MSPILPTCNTCGSEAEVTGDTQGVKIILLNGTCGSGKSTTAEELVKSHGYLAIDGDCVLQVVRHRHGMQQVSNNSPEMIDEFGREIDILSAVGRKIVLSTVVEPEDFRKFTDMFESKGLDYRIILLKPNYETAVKRTQTRTCHGSITPEKWVRHFYDKLAFDDADTFDNSALSVEESAIAILQKCNYVDI